MAVSDIYYSIKMARRKKRSTRVMTHMHHEGRRYRPGTRHIRSTHGGHAGQKGGWLGALFSGFMTGAKTLLPHLLAGGAQIGAQAASGAIQQKQQEAMQRRAEERQHQQTLAAEARQRGMYGL